jgi:hypothetical protein
MKKADIKISGTSSFDKTRTIIVLTIPKVSKEGRSFIFEVNNFENVGSVIFSFFITLNNMLRTEYIKPKKNRKKNILSAG